MHPCAGAPFPFSQIVQSRTGRTLRGVRHEARMYRLAIRSPTHSPSSFASHWRSPLTLERWRSPALTAGASSTTRAPTSAARARSATRATRAPGSGSSECRRHGRSSVRLRPALQKVFRRTMAAAVVGTVAATLQTTTKAGFRAKSGPCRVLAKDTAVIHVRRRRNSSSSKFFRDSKWRTTISTVGTKSVTAAATTPIKQTTPIPAVAILGTNAADAVATTPNTFSIYRR